MKGTLAMACTQGGLYQHNWREQSDVPIPERLFNVTIQLHIYVPIMRACFSLCSLSLPAIS